MTSQAQAERLAKNEALFRDVNERVRHVSRDEWHLGEHGTFLCECVDPDCLERVTVELAVYERTRDAPDRFLLKPGHERPDLEFVIDSGETYVIVEKREETKDVVAESDPRS